jgi:hypothetical protein
MTAEGLRLFAASGAFALDGRFGRVWPLTVCGCSRVLCCPNVAQLGCRAHTQHRGLREAEVPRAHSCKARHCPAIGRNAPKNLLALLPADDHLPVLLYALLDALLVEVAGMVSCPKKLCGDLDPLLG